jgi:hypothetical protein
MRELGEYGYYRIVRRRQGGPGGHWITETEVTPSPDPDWVERWKACDGKPQVITSEDANPQVTPENGFPGFGNLGAGNPGAGNPGAGGPGVGAPDAGEPGGEPKPLSHDSHHSDSSLRSESAAVAQATLDGAAPTEDPKAARRRQAEEVARAWYGYYAEHIGPPANWRHVALRRMIEAALEHYTERQVRDALAALRRPLPGAREWQDALVEIHAGRPPVVPGQGRTPGNVHRDRPDDPKHAARRDAFGPGAGR